MNPPKPNYGKTHIAPTLEREMVEKPLTGYEQMLVDDGRVLGETPKTPCIHDTDGDGDCHLCHNKGGCFMLCDHPASETKPNADDIACASAACDLVAGCNGQVTGSHLARVAQLFADHRVRVEDAIAADFRKALESANAGDEKAKA